MCIILAHLYCFVIIIIIILIALQPPNLPLPPLTSNELTCDFDVSVEISEDDGKGGYSSVPLDKDCFKLRQNTKKKIALTVAQPSAARPLVIER